LDLIKYKIASDTSSVDTNLNSEYLGFADLEIYFKFSPHCIFINTHLNLNLNNKMKTMISIKSFFLAGLLMMASQWTFAQGQAPASPKMTVTGLIGKANVTLVYSGPSVKGRKVWGELVPMDKVWRAGANSATTIETDADISVGGNNLPKGKYSIYMIPSEGEWQVIFNTEVGQWGIKRGGETTRNAEKDVFIVKVKPKKSDFKEVLEYKVVAKGVSFGWENIELLIPAK
jgi:hypothetical protein